MIIFLPLQMQMLMRRKAFFIPLYVTVLLFCCWSLHQQSSLSLLQRTVDSANRNVHIHLIQRTVQDVPFLISPDFPRQLNRHQYAHVIHVLERVDKLFTDYNITWVMSFGTLLGSYMCHDLLPWDDVLDVCIYHKDVRKLIELHEQDKMINYGLGMYIFFYSCQDHTNMTFVPNKTTIHKCNHVKLKLFDSFSMTGAIGYEWTWPFVDVRTFDYNDTHAWINNRVKEHQDWVYIQHTVTQEKFLPLHKRPFGRLLLPSPRSPKEVMASRYMNKEYGASFTCKTSYWNHIEEKAKTMLQVKCSSLSPYYPFVHRKVLQEGEVLEILYVGNSSYNMFTVVEPYEKDWQPSPYQLIWW